jgi:hypothetical protein
LGPDLKPVLNRGTGLAGFTANSIDSSQHVHTGTGETRQTGMPAAADTATELVPYQSVEQDIGRTEERRDGVPAFRWPEEPGIAGPALRLIRPVDCLFQ